MNRLKKRLVPAALIAGLLFSTPCAGVYAADDLDFSYMLKKVAEIDDPAKKELGVELFKEYMDRENPDVEGLKRALNIATDSGTKQQITDAGYTLSEVLSKLDVLEDMSKGEIDTLLDAVEANDFTSEEIKEIANKYDGVEEQAGGSGGGGGGSTGTAPQTPSEQEKTEAQESLGFKDIHGHWAKETILELYGKGIIKGQSQDSFNPNGSITRAEFTALIVRALGIQGVGGIEFEDVNDSDWFYGVVASAKSAGIINGISQSSFAPNDNVTREQMVKIIMGALEYKGKQLQPAKDMTSYTDGSSVSEWAKDSMGKALSNGVINGQSEKTIAPRAMATRAEAAAVIKRVMDID
ncbi:exoglucanase XynX [Peptoclostridium acidaminophilum DSM 3953]|uniref:Exoglucanase XynX n=1 Tax=Peptoclostridium acidaminophilum DSM 3953 TaxID=1286171 RepID=W8U8X4_PEPAC|nr:S-layer homology domain-containing protein [Peptoclostridium acidaminophilum]AHM57306.1 exoglucanase XynX [Peptoclostridium acidaminophilum DSM 3953]